MTYLPFLDCPQFLFSYVPPYNSNLKELAKLAGEIIQVYTAFFKADPPYFHLINDYTNDRYPMTCRDPQIIFVNCPDFYCWQFVYQFTHELCHWMIPGDVADNLRWLEKTICVASSWFFYNKIALADQSALSDYMSRQALDIIHVNIQELFIPNSTAIQYLETGSPDYTDYQKYKYIAFRLLPAINENPLFWVTVPYLCKIESGLSLNDSLDKWISLIPSGPEHCSLSEVISFFRRLT